jgi:hypothetical protein
MPILDRDTRREKRVLFTMHAPVTTDSGERFEESSTTDISALGVRLQLRGQIVPGQIVDVYLNPRPERCRVVWTWPVGTDHELIAGLEFIRPLGDQ